MFKKCFVSLLALWSWQNADAVVVNPFEFFNEQQEKGISTICEKTDPIKMPPMRSQGDLPVCVPISSATIVQARVCKVVKNACIDGVPTSAKTTVSPLSMLAWVRPNPGKGIRESASDYTSLKFYTTEPGGIVDALGNASEYPTFFSESCFPMDQLINKVVVGPNKKLTDIKDVIQTIEKEYTKAHLEGDGTCKNCLKGSVLEVNATALGISAQKIAEKLVDAKKEKASPSQFLHKLMLDKCEDLIELRSSQAKFGSFPTNPKDFEYKELIKKMKEVLKGGNPLGLDGICIELKNDGTCKTFHSVAISGYRKVCKNVVQKDTCSVECRDVVKVHNSWGADWQRELEIAEEKEVGDGEGWVDAEKLMAYMIKHKKHMENALSWYY